MGKIGVLLLVFCLFMGLGFVVAENGDEPSVPGGADGSGVDTFNRLQGNYSPLDDDGEFNFSKYKPFKSKAEERVEAINVYVGWLSVLLFGVELSLSWIFVFSFFLWFVLATIIYNPVKEIFGFNAIAGVIVAVLIATISMRSFGKGFVVWIDSIATAWWASLLVVFGSIIFVVGYTIFMKFFGKKIREGKESSEKRKTQRDREIIGADADLSKKRLGMEE